MSLLNNISTEGNKLISGDFVGLGEDLISGVFGSIVKKKEGISQQSIDIHSNIRPSINQINPGLALDFDKNQGITATTNWLNAFRNSMDTTGWKPQNLNQVNIFDKAYHDLKLTDLEGTQTVKNMRKNRASSFLNTIENFIKGFHL